MVSHSWTLKKPHSHLTLDGGDAHKFIAQSSVSLARICHIICVSVARSRYQSAYTHEVTTYKYLHCCVNGLQNLQANAFFFFHPHLNIKSNKSAYITGICFRFYPHLHIKYNKSVYITGICFRMYSEIQQIVKLQTIDFIEECIWKKNQSICLQSDNRGL